MAVTGGSDAHIASQWQIASDEAFTQIIHDSGETRDLASHALTKPLDNHASYFWRVRYKAARLDWSNWSDAQPFRARMGLISACTSCLIGPASSFDHQASEWEIRSADSNNVLIWSSGVTSTELTKVMSPGCPAPGTKYRARVRYRFGAEWSNWSDDAVFTSERAPINEAIFVDDGDWTVPSGVTSISGVAIGAGAWARAATVRKAAAGWLGLVIGA